MNIKVFVLVALLGIGIAVGLLLDVHPVTIHGRTMHGPLYAVFGGLGSILAATALIILAILSAPLIGCFGLIMIMVLGLVGFTLLMLVSPLLLPLVVLFLVFWAYRSGVRNGRRINLEQPADSRA